MAVAVVLYEDNRGPQPRGGFGPHQLALACVADDVGIDRWALGDAIVDNVTNSNSKVVKACRERWDAFVAGGAVVVAVLDSDKVHECLSLPPQACRPLVRERVAGAARRADEFVLALLERRTEDLMEAAARAIGRPLPRPVPKNINLRDSILNAAAAHADRGVRVRIRADMPSFDRLVRKLADAWRARAVLGPRA